MTTIEDKINLFASILFEKVDKQSEEKLEQANKYIDERYSAVKERIQDVSRQIIAERVRKSEVKSTQIISKASIEAKQNLLNKKEELLNKTIKDLRGIVYNYVQTPEYSDFLQHAIEQVFSGLQKEQQLLFYFTPDDLQKYAGLIRNTIIGNLQTNAVFTLHETDRDIIGGCMCQNNQNTRRVDYTMAALLEDKRDIIGQIVMDNLQI